MARHPFDLRGRDLATRGVASLLTALIFSCTNPSLAISQTTEPQSPTPAVAHVVQAKEVDDTKSVLATVRSKKVIEARVRTPGTVAALNVVEGAHVEPGQVLGLVADPKIALRIRASDAQIVALQSRVATAQADLERTTELQKRGVAPQSRLDQAKTAFDVATNELAAARAERAVVEKQVEEGQVLAPAPGRVLRVPVTEGSVVLAGESIATIAAQDYLLRLELPERHARFIQKDNKLLVEARGLERDQQSVLEGRIVQVYPEIQTGRVIADAEVSGLGSYFVGERTLAWVSAGRRNAILIPRDLVFNRHGLDYVRLATGAGRTIDIVVQLGRAEVSATAAQRIEILSGVKPGDQLVKP